VARQTAIHCTSSREETNEVTENLVLPVQKILSAVYLVPAAWAYVTSWKSPEKVLGSSAGDVLTDPAIRAGRPVAIDATAIVDWAVWIDGQGIIEGGQTDAVAIQEGKEKGAGRE
jgi:hypothetical protein